jgi:nuclear GTP-binding protein
MSLIRDDDHKTKNGVRIHHAKNVVEASSFKDTFGPKAQRKRVKIGIASFDDMAGESVKQHDSYLDRREQALLLSGQLNPDEDRGEELEDVKDGVLVAPRESIFSKGQSKRIWNELYKVIDSSDVIIHVLDARDPVGTRCLAVEKYLKEEAPHKHLVFVLNKCDLVPTAVAVSFIHISVPVKICPPAPSLVKDCFAFVQFHEAILLQLWEIDSKFAFKDARFECLQSLVCLV